MILSLKIKVENNFNYQNYEKMMLVKINEGKVESDEGFSIQITEPENMKYQEGIFWINISWDYDPKTRKTHVYASEITQWSNLIGHFIGAEDKVRIGKNIGDAMKLLKGNFEVV